jgi:multidrug efflux system outer membrane protein
MKISVVILSLIFSQFAGAATPSSLALNPDTIQRQLLKNNTSVLIGFNQVKQAKDEVNIARGNLLPSLNLGGLLSFSGGGFILSTIDFLVPFLVPSNWANYYSTKSTFEAEKISYKVIQLNTYGSALSLYYTLLSDNQVQGIYQQQYQDLQDIYELQKRKSNTGVIPVSDLLQTQAQAQMAGVRASQLTELNKQEFASIRKAMALPLTTNLSLEFVDVKASPWEFESIKSTVNQVNKVSVERQQVRFLLKAAQDQVWSSTFGWINGASIGAKSSGSGNASLSNSSASGSITLGFATYPKIQLSQDQVKEIELQDQELALENSRIVESALNSLVEAKQQLDLATQAENQMARVYQIRVQEYDQGTENLTNVLLARTQMADASVARIKSNLDVNLQRSLMQRALISGEYSDVRGCSSSAKMPEAPKKQGWLGRHLNPKIPAQGPSLDDICR